MSCPSVVIRNPHSGLVLDASQIETKLQNYTGLPSQLWTLEPAGLGKYFITNKENGKVMDIQGGTKAGAKIITHPKHGGVNQQWFINSDLTIVSATGNLAVDICQEKYIPGAAIIAFAKHGRANQVFSLQYQ